MSYEYIEHTADVGFTVRANSLEELFQESAEALINIMTPVSKIKCVEKRVIELEAETLEDLLYDFLSEFLYLLDSEKMVFGKFRVRIQQEDSLKLSAEVCGEKVDPERHVFESYVKAITYHDLTVRKEPDGWFAKVVVDI
ncbi:MAG: protein archease [Archaeoglobi archaeon]|nr:archease [Candidatus Mnemosynella bozhongmuii]MDI3502704.1 protein archease [Archaeoglobi archaeon]MDK2781025.1 protein archease [Archaeoglobi archaeon]